MYNLKKSKAAIMSKEDFKAGANAPSANDFMVKNEEKSSDVASVVSEKP